MQERPVAVTIFGILNIGYGVFLLVGTVMSGMFEDMGAMASNPNLKSIVAYMDALHKDPGYILWMKISVPVEVLACLVLIAAGIGLLRLKNWARVASIGYAIYKIVFSLLVVVVLFHALHGMLAETIRQSGSLLMITLVATAVAALLGMLISLAYPVLLIFFLTRPKILPAFAPAAPVSDSTL